MKCHQRKIRDGFSASDPHPIMETLSGCHVERITKAEAEVIILKYEWLGAMATANRANYGLLTPDRVLIGVACFGQANGSRSHFVCGADLAPKTICLERGTCIHWAHPHAGSFLVSKACKLAAKDFGWEVFFAYSDPEAGEIGTIYQACNWVYQGQSPGRAGSFRSRYVNKKTKQTISSRTMRGLKKKGAFYPELWTTERSEDKHRYVNFVGGKKRVKQLKKLMVHPSKEYPKRHKE